MKKSHYLQITRIKLNVYVAFNSLVMQPVFLNFINMICLKYGLFNYFNKNNIFNLKKAGIICENEELDNRAFLNVKNTINNNIKNKITLMYLIPNNNCNLMCKYCFT